MKKSTKTQRMNQKKSLLVLSIAVGLLVSLYAYMHFATSVTQHETKIYSIEGTVYTKRTSCGLEQLQSDGTVQRGGGVCDGGNSLTVDKLRINTGGGSLGSRSYPYYISDIKSIHAGDVVEVKYVLDKSGYANTNCASCYVKKQGSSNTETQEKIEKPTLK